MGDGWRRANDRGRRGPATHAPAHAQRSDAGLCRAVAGNACGRCARRGAAWRAGGSLHVDAGRCCVHHKGGGDGRALVAHVVHGVHCRGIHEAPLSRKVILWERPGCGMSRPQQEGAGQAAVQAGSRAPSHERGAALVTTPGGQVSLPDVRPLPTGKDIGAVGQVAEGSRGGAWGIGRGVCRRRRRRRARFAPRQPAVVRGAAGKHQMF